MKRPLLLCSLLGLALPVLPAQVEKSQSPPKPEAQEPEPDIDGLIRRLGDASYRERRQAEAALRKQGEAARDALREAADQHQDPEVRWRASRLLRQLDDGETRGQLRERARAGAERPDVTPAPRGRFTPLGPGGIERQFDELFRRLERDFGVDVPRHRFFEDDFFQDLEAQMKSLEERLRDMRGQGRMAESMQMQVGPDGVRLELKHKTPDGKDETKVYEAPDLQTFRDKYPEIAQRHLGGFHVTPWSVGPRTWPQVAQPWRVAPPEAPPLEREEPPTDPDRLGVHVREVTPELREFLGLDEGVGLVVDSVVDGTLAAEAGLKQNDILLEVAGREIRSPEDVREALSGIEAGGKVEVAVNRRGSRKTLTGTKPTVRLEDSNERDRGGSGKEPPEQKAAEQPDAKAEAGGRNVKR